MGQLYARNNSSITNTNSSKTINSPVAEFEIFFSCPEQEKFSIPVFLIPFLYCEIQPNTQVYSLRLTTVNRLGWLGEWAGFINYFRFQVIFVT